MRGRAICLFFVAKYLKKAMAGMEQIWYTITIKYSNTTGKERIEFFG